MNSIPDIPSELEAEKRLLQAEQERIQSAKRRRDSLAALAGNADFINAWVNGYLADDRDEKLRQLEDCAVVDLPIARQRYLDAKAMLEAIRSDIADICATAR
jgi:hypothetical protein